MTLLTHGNHGRLDTAAATAVVLTLVCLAAWLASSAAAAPRAFVVSLSAAGTSEPIGRQVRLVAKTNKLPAGGRLVIQGRRAGGAKALTFARCAAARCTGLWGEGKAGSVRFQALVVKGARVIARSRALIVAWARPSPAPAPAPIPAPPPPAPSPAAGHYCGLTNEGKSICFDVGAGATISNLRTESIVNCGDGSRWIWTFSFDGPDKIQQPALTFAKTQTGSVPDSPGATGLTITYSVAATFDTAGNANGTISLSHASWDGGGKHYDCGGDPRTWTARLGA